MENNDNSRNGGVGIATVLTLIFVVLKLCKVIDWSWVWVLSPIWISLALAAVILVIFYIVAFIIGLHDKR